MSPTENVIRGCRTVALAATLVQVTSQCVDGIEGGKAASFEIGQAGFNASAHVGKELVSIDGHNHLGGQDDLAAF